MQRANAQAQADGQRLLHARGVEEEAARRQLRSELLAAEDAGRAAQRREREAGREADEVPTSKRCIFSK